jgi:t-SNARE complex subunit (syntaxin)
VLAANPNKKDRTVRFDDNVTTIRLDDTTSLVELQRAQLEQQDRHLDSLADTVGRTKHLAVSISDELDAQVALVDELDSKVDRTRGKMGGATSRLQRVVHSVQRDRSTQVVCGLSIVVAIAIILIIVLKTAL